MGLAPTDHRAMLVGFERSGFACLQSQAEATNPVRIEWHVNGQIRRYRLWAFEITHGGGGEAVRAADEFRIQITNGPATSSAFDSDGTTDLLLGYSRERDAIVAYDRRWLENWSRKKESTGSGGSPSVQVKESDIQAGHDNGIHHLSKQASFGDANIVTMSPTMLPAYLLNYDEVLRGDMTPEQARAASPDDGANIVDYCRHQGFPFEPDLIARYIAAMLTKPFVILAGVSGTGKSKLAELVAEFYGATTGATTAAGVPHAVPTGQSFVFSSAKGPPDRTRFALVPVRPDWIDNQAVLGFVNPITEAYESTQALDLIMRARAALAASANKAAAPRYFMLLDEMNLARVEHYFSDWLSCTESRRLRPDGNVTQQAVPLHRSQKSMWTSLARPDGTVENVEVPPSLELPTNLVVTGTVNVDETTHGFSPKVLDRAMVLEFDEVDLDRLRTGGSGLAVGDYRFPDELPAFRLATEADYAGLPPGVHVHLLALNSILQESRLHFGYRAANEMALFIEIYNGILPHDPADSSRLRALDAAILHKVLPRLNGNRAKLEAPLARLCVYLRDLATPGSDVAAEEFDTDAKAALPKAYKRAVEMLASLRGFGFVSFFK